MVEMVLNELSLRNPAQDIATARQWMLDLIGIVRAAKAQSTKQATLRTQYDFLSTLLASDYPLRRWLNDTEVDPEIRRFIKTLATKAPFSNDITNTEIQDLESNQSNSEFLFQGKRAIGLGVAYLIEALPVSFLSEKCWDCNRLKLEVIQLDDDEDSIVEIVHASRIIHVKEHANWLQNITRQEVRDGLDLWNRKSDLFPHLVFCEVVEKQVVSLLEGQPMLRSVEKRLFELDNASRAWTSGNFDFKNIPSKVTPESDSRLKTLAAQLTFKCPDGENRLFSWHLRMTPGDWRLHFYVDSGRQQIVIGYIGRKVE